MSATENQPCTTSQGRERRHSPLGNTSVAERWIAIAVFVLSCLYLCLFLNFSNLNGDEGIILQGAERILHGEVLYRDFFSFYTPGSYYWLATLFTILGNSMFVARATLVIYGGLFSLLSYVLARRVCARWSALFAAYMVALTCLPYRFLVTHWEGTMLAYFALYCAVVWVERSSQLFALATASFTAITCLFEEATGAGLVLGFLLGLGVLTWKNEFRHTLRRQWWLVLVGFLWPFILTAIYFAAKGSLAVMLASWVWPLNHYWVTNKVPYGFVITSAPWELWSQGWASRAIMLLVLGPLLWIPVLPVVAVGIFLWVSLHPAAKSQYGRAWPYWVLVSACVSGLLFSLLGMKRPDFTHINYVAPIFFTAFAWLVDGLRLHSRLWRVSAPILVLYISLSATAFGMAMLWPTLGAHHWVKTARGDIKTDDTQTLDYVLAHVTPDAKIFIYPYEPMYYYLTGTFSPTRFDILQLGMHTPEQFQESLRSLEKDETPIVLFETSVREKLAWTSPETPIRLLTAKDPVEAYILAHYRRCAGPMTNSYWRFEFMTRKDLPCPNSGQPQ